MSFLDRLIGLLEDFRRKEIVAIDKSLEGARFFYQRPYDMAIIYTMLRDTNKPRHLLDFLLTVKYLNTIFVYARFNLMSLKARWHRVNIALDVDSRIAAYP